MLKSYRKLHGQIIILFAILIPFIFGFLGLAIDTSLLVFNKEKLQNAVDLSGLSAAHEIVKNHGQVESTAIDFAKKNGVKASELKVVYPYNGDNSLVQLIATRKIELYFLPILGLKNTTVSAEAIAQAVQESKISYSEQSLQYAIFSGSTTTNIDIKGNSSVINGNVHGNRDVNYHGKGHIINGNLETASGKFGGTGGVTIRGTIDKAAPVLPMPDLAFDQYAAKAKRVFQGDQIFNNVDIDGVWLINGNVTLNGGRIRGKGIILATGSVSFPGNRVEYSSADDLLAVYSKGDITLTCTKNNIQGVLYSPNGTIRINGSDNTFYGALIANEIYWVQSDFTINGDYDIRVPQAFKVIETKFRLIK